MKNKNSLNEKFRDLEKDFTNLKKENHKLSFKILDKYTLIDIYLNKFPKELYNDYKQHIEDILYLNLENYEKNMSKLINYQNQKESINNKIFKNCIKDTIYLKYVLKFYKKILSLLIDKNQVVLNFESKINKGFIFIKNLLTRLNVYDDDFNDYIFLLKSFLNDNYFNLNMYNSHQENMITFFLKKIINFNNKQFEFYYLILLNRLYPIEIDSKQNMYFYNEDFDYFDIKLFFKSLYLEEKLFQDTYQYSSKKIFNWSKTSLYRIYSKKINPKCYYLSKFIMSNNFSTRMIYKDRFLYNFNNIYLVFEKNKKNFLFDQNKNFENGDKIFNCENKLLPKFIYPNFKNKALKQNELVMFEKYNTPPTLYKTISTLYDSRVYINDIDYIKIRGNFSFGKEQKKITENIIKQNLHRFNIQNFNNFEFEIPEKGDNYFKIYTKNFYNKSSCFYVNSFVIKVLKFEKGEKKYTIYFNDKKLKCYSKEEIESDVDYLVTSNFNQKIFLKKIKLL